MQNTNNPKVSIIIPIYNVEKYIKKCICSLFEQTLDDIEYIFVNDCTPDNSMKILEQVIKKYPERSKQVKIVVHKNNKGLATARNSELNLATGEYVIHCDSDDWIDKDMYEKMYQKAIEEDADIVGCDFYDEYTDHNIIRKQNFPEDNKQCIMKFLEGKLYCSVWNKLIKRSIYSQNNIHFPNGVNMWEDVITIIYLCFHSQKITYIPQPFYHYIHYNSESYTYKPSKQSLNNLITAIDLIENFFITQQVYKDFQKGLFFMKLTVKLNLLLGSRGKQQKEWNKLYPQANKYILFYSSMSWYWRIALLTAAYKFIFLFNLLAYIGNRIK